MIARLVSTRIHYAWIATGTTFLALICAAVRSTPSVLMVPLQHEFGWDRATISEAGSVVYGWIFASHQSNLGCRS